MPFHLSKTIGYAISLIYLVIKTYQYLIVEKYINGNLKTIMEKNESLRKLLALTFIPGVGPKLSKNLISYCGGVEGVFNANRAKLEKVPGIGEVLADTILLHDTFEQADKELEFIEKNDIRVLAHYEVDYPQRFRKCVDSPLLLFTKGAMSVNIPKIIGMVGTRKATAYGKDVCMKLITDLASRGVTVVSGMAYGIDICAHNAALKNNLQTIGVLAHGLDRLYPSAHKPSAVKMLANGGLISEYPSGTNPDRENFVQRNRIIAGMSDAVIVVESGEKGGALFTAAFASNYNHDVFAIPGRANDPMSRGCNRLIKTNIAALLETADDLCESMGWNDEVRPNKSSQPKIPFVDLTDNEKIIYDFINESADGLDIDALTIKSNIPGRKVVGILLQMEFAGIVKSLPGKIYQIV